MQFEWSETDPPAGECSAGLYSGNFQCELDSAGFFPVLPLAGSVTFELQESADGEFLEITHGTVAGALAGGFIAFTAEVEGRLDCGNDSFQANAVNGTSTGGDFTGQLIGWLDRGTQELLGAWSFGTQAWPPCVGLWHVRRLSEPGQ